MDHSLPFPKSTVTLLLIKSGIDPYEVILTWFEGILYCLLWTRQTVNLHFMHGSSHSCRTNMKAENQ